MLLRMEMRWAERRGFKVELVEASAGGGGRHQVGHRSSRAARTPTGSSRAEKGVHRLVRISPFDAPVAPPHELRAGGGLAARGRGHRRRDRRAGPPDRHLPRVGRRRPAREQDRLRGADHAPPERDRRAVPERALAVVEQGDRDGDAALEAARARGAASAARSSRRRRARRRTSAGARRSAPTCCSPTRWSRTTARTTRWATRSACSTATSTASCARSCCGARAAGATGPRASARRASARADRNTMRASSSRSRSRSPSLPIRTSTLISHTATPAPTKPAQLTVSPVAIRIAKPADDERERDAVADGDQRDLLMACLYPQYRRDNLPRDAGADRSARSPRTSARAT